ncbi:unnamed protein product [Symbiodinium sp. CCMP2592]|nr:unnamed protein product [Symbiodinium sp. CCMP2592]
MAEAGRISKPLVTIKEALHSFYYKESQEMEETPETSEMKLRRERNITKSAKAILSMLTVIKRKWTKWELPRDEDIRDMVLDLAKAVSKAYSASQSNRARVVFKFVRCTAVACLQFRWAVPDCWSACSIQEGRCALAKSPRQPAASVASTDCSSEMDDESLRADLLSMSGRSSAESQGSTEARGSSLLSYLKAPPQEELERLLGISLNPEAYRKITAVARADAPKDVGHVVENPGGPDSEVPGAGALVPDPAPEVAAPVEEAAEAVDAGGVSHTGDDGEGLLALQNDSPSKNKPDPLLKNANVPKELVMQSAPDLTRRKLAFDDSDADEQSTSAGREIDCLGEPVWSGEPESYVDEWLRREREADEARIAASARSQRLKRAAALLEEEESASVLTRQDQLGMTAGKKGKLNNGDADEEEASEPEVPAKKGGKKVEASEDGVDDEEPAGDEPAGDDPPAPSSRKNRTKLVRKSTKHRLIAKHKKGKKGNKGKKSAKAADAADLDNKTEYYSGEDWPGDEEEYDGAAPEELPAERPAKRGRGQMHKKAKPAKASKPEPAEEEEEEEQEKNEEGGEEKVSTFARRYCPTRPLFKAKFLGIRDAFDLRIRPFLKFPGKLEDDFWKYVAQATKEDKISDPDAWAKVFILAVLCLLFNERFRLEKDSSSPRNYTKEFAEHMVELFPNFNECPALRHSSMIDASTRDKLRRMDMGADDWLDAGVPELLKYVYGAKGLVIPPEWRDCFPGAHFQ